MKPKKLSPNQISGMAFFGVAVLGICATAVIALLPPSTDRAQTISLVTNATCPVAIAVGLIAYFWAKTAHAQPSNQPGPNDQDGSHQP